MLKFISEHCEGDCIVTWKSKEGVWHSSWNVKDDASLLGAIEMLRNSARDDIRDRTTET